MIKFENKALYLLTNVFLISLGILFSWEFLMIPLFLNILLIGYIHIFYAKGNGLRYGIKSFKLHNNILHELYLSKLFVDNEKEILPLVNVNLSEDYKHGKIVIKDTVKFREQLLDINLNPALYEFIVEDISESRDGNDIIYEIYNSNYTTKMKFDDFLHLDRYSYWNCKNYELFLDTRTIVDLQHSLIVGHTGSGKTYAAYSLILQLLTKSNSPNLFIADPKSSSMYLIGNLINPKQSATDHEDIMSMIEDFNSLMNERKKEYEIKLRGKITGDYRTFYDSPNILIIDEYASFSSKLDTLDKKTRDKVTNNLHEVILQGRQLGFFVIILMQKSDAKLLPTILRDNLTLKIVLGNSDDQTFITTFGHDYNRPNFNMRIGQGIYTDSTSNKSFRVVEFPMLNFDIEQAVESRAHV